MTYGNGSVRHGRIAGAAFNGLRLGRAQFKQPSFALPLLPSFVGLELLQSSAVLLLLLLLLLVRGRSLWTRPVLIVVVLVTGGVDARTPWHPPLEEEAVEASNVSFEAFGLTGFDLIPQQVFVPQLFCGVGSMRRDGHQIAVHQNEFVHHNGRTIGCGGIVVVVVV